jgi:hypothetical protein
VSRWEKGNRFVMFTLFAGIIERLNGVDSVLFDSCLRFLIEDSVDVCRERVSGSLC